MNYNSPYYQLRRKILFDLLAKYPNLSNKGTARILFRDNPTFFTDLEHARSFVRMYRGRTGQLNRDKITRTKFYKNDI